jgi:DNA-binding LacI/PurR family transcriptional regulator
MVSGQPGGRPAVMHDVARLAGVSHQTVSRVVNDHPNVRETTRERVRDAMRQLNYHPNAVARALASRRSRSLGVISFDTRLFGPASTLLGIERAARVAGYTVTLSSLADLDAPSVRRAVAALADQSVDGVIVIASRESAARGVRDMRDSLPIVTIEGGYADDIPVVSVDQLAGARLATERLLGAGHRTVWHVAGPADWLEAQERVAGWRAALTDAGVRVPRLVRGDWTPGSGYRAGQELAANRDVTAVFVANDHMALGLLRAFHEAGVRVPDDISIVGFDNIPEAEYFLPALTTVRQDFDELGKRAFRLLLDVMDGTDAPVVGGRIPPTLIERDSVGAPPAQRR